MSFPPRVGAHAPVLPELSFVTERQNRAGAAAPISPVNDPQVLLDLEQKMSAIFAPHQTPENKQALGALVKDRAAQLQAMGQTAADVERLLDKATRMDRVTLPVQGAIGSVPFAVASVLLDKVPDITAKAAASAPYTGFVAGSLSGAVDAVGSGMLSRATHDTFWLKAPADVLEPVMQQAQSDRASATHGSLALESAVAFQTFTLRNVVRGLVSTALHATHNPNAAAAVDTALSSAGGMAAGAGYATHMRKNDLNAHRAGPEYLFGRQDWKQQYETLRDCSPSRDPLINGGKRLAKLPLDIMTDTAKSLGKALSASSFAANGLALGGGGALTTTARSAINAAAAQAGLSAGALAAADGAANVGLSALSFGAYGAVAALSDPASEAAVKVLQEDVPPKAASLAQAAGETLMAGAERGADAVAGLVNQFRQRPVRESEPDV